MALPVIMPFAPGPVDRALRPDAGAHHRPSRKNKLGCCTRRWDVSTLLVGTDVGAAPARRHTPHSSAARTSRATSSR